MKPATNTIVADDIFAILDGLAGPSIVSRELEHDGKVVNLHFRKWSGDEADTMMLGIMGNDGKVDKAKFHGNAARQIAASLCTPDGKPVGNAKKINSYPADLREKLIKIVSELNGGKVVADSVAANDSGSPSPSDSAEPSST